MARELAQAAEREAAADAAGVAVEAVAVAAVEEEPQREDDPQDIALSALSNPLTNCKRHSGLGVGVTNHCRLPSQTRQSVGCTEESMRRRILHLENRVKELEAEKVQRANTMWLETSKGGLGKVKILRPLFSSLRGLR